jgi:hypothetical protein
MLLEDKHKCEKCNVDFEWYYLVSQPADSGKLQAYTLPDNKASVSTVLAYDENRAPARVSVRCPRCDELNTFDVSA